MATANQSKRYLGNRSVYFGPDLPETDLEEGFLFFKTGDGLYIYRNFAWESVATGGGGTYLPLAGGTLTGPLTLSANPTTNLHAATKQYVDSIVVGGGVASFNTRTGAVTLQASDITSIDGSGSGIDADLLDGQHASAFATSGHTHTGTYLPIDMNYNNIGSLCFVEVSSGHTVGSTVSGATLQPAGVNGISQPDGTPQVVVSGSLSGTWRILGYSLTSGDVTLAQRIA